MSDAPVIPPADRLPDRWRAGGWNSPAGANLALAAGLWFWLCGELWYEWSISEQYGYGLFVPFLTTYLLWLRVGDCPAPQPWGRDGPVLAFLGLVALAQYPIAVIFAANADWRLLAWSEAGLAMTATLLLLMRWGGWPWVRHFTLALALILFAVPWPSYVQIHLVDWLMTFVATVTTGLLHLLGYTAEQQGHIIKLPNSLVSVEEACSGVRSIQSTIMAGWLVGEMWRFRALGRAGLLAWAVAIAVLFNLLRTFALAWISAAQGPAAMERWHDTAGYLVFGLSFATVLGGAWLARPRRRLAARDAKAATRMTGQPHWLPKGVMVIILAVLAGAWPARAAWYAAREPDVSTKIGWKLDLAAAAPTARPQPLSDELKQSLYFEQGIQSVWLDSSGRQWLLYNLQWTDARAAQLGGVHSPELCLPAVGWTMVQQFPDLIWQHGGVLLHFNTYAFVHGRNGLFVFYCQWDPAGYPYYDKTGRFRYDRLVDAWHADRKLGKQLLEIALGNVSTYEEARRAVTAFLDAAIVEQPPGSAKK